MNRIHFKGGPAFKGLVMGGMVAGALGLAVSNQTTDYSGKDAGSNLSVTGQKAEARNDTSGEFGVPGSQGGSSMPGMGGTGDMSAAQLPPNVTPGWKIRVCSEKTKASNINFKVSSADKNAKGSGTGMTGESGSMGGTGSASDTSQATGAEAQSGQGGTGMEQTAMWSQGEPTEIALPSQFQDAQKIKLEATPGEKDKSASVCVLYNDHVAKKLKFDDREVSTIKQSENGECGC